MVNNKIFYGCVFPLEDFLMKFYLGEFKYDETRTLTEQLQGTTITKYFTVFERHEEVYVGLMLKSGTAFTGESVTSFKIKDVTVAYDRACDKASEYTIMPGEPRLYFMQNIE